MKDSTAVRVFAAARQRFLDSGFENVSIEMIARDARVSKQSIYALYPSKEMLFADVMRKATSEAIASSKRIVPLEDRPLIELLNESLRQYMSYTLDPQIQGLFRASLATVRLFPELAAELFAQYVAGMEPLTASIEAQFPARSLASMEPGTIGRRAAAVAVQGMRYMLAFAAPSSREQEILIAHAIAIMLGGYAAASQCLLVSEEECGEDAKMEQRAAVRLPQERVDQLLEIAAEHFITSGFRATNIEGIVSSSGISVTTIYRQFGDKTGLFRAAVRHLATRQFEVSQEAAVEAPLETAVAALARQVLDRHLDPKSVALQRLMISESDRFPDLARSLYERMLTGPSRKLSALLYACDASPPSPLDCRAFHTLATYGVRFIATSESANDLEREKLSKEAARLFLYGCGG